MITTATYLLIAQIGDEQYHFEYEDCYDVWTALEQFWHEDYPETLITKKDSGLFPITVLSMLEGKVIATYPFTFNHLCFHAFFDNGHTADGPFTLNQFAEHIRRDDPEPATPRDVIALWSDWCMDYDDENLWLDYMVNHPKAHCNRQHLQDKWDYCYGKYGNKAAMNMFWRELDNDNREILTEYITTKYNH